MTSKKAIALSLAVICLGLFCFALCGCTIHPIERPEDYTLEEHIARITPRIEKRYINPETRKQEYSHITGYKLYPLYDNEDKLQYFLIEFEPYGFASVSMRKTTPFIGMYFREEGYMQDSWQRYRVCIDGVEPDPYEGRQWQPMERSYNENFRFEVNDNGEFVKYNHSPYAIAGVLDQKLYMLDLHLHGVPAIKQNGKFINLVSMDEFVCEGNLQYYKQKYEEFGDKYVENIPGIFWGFFIKHRL